MKLDIEGFEHKVLSHFIKNANKTLFPKFIITEFLGDESKYSTGNQISLLKDYGYQDIKFHSGYNKILKLQ